MGNAGWRMRFRERRWARHRDNPGAGRDHVEVPTGTVFGLLGPSCAGKLNFGRSYTVEILERRSDLAVLVPANMTLPSGANARIVPLTAPEPCVQWSLIWRSGDRNPRLASLLRVLTKLSAEEGWLRLDPERQWLIGTSPLSRRLVVHSAVRLGYLGVSGMSGGVSGIWAVCQGRAAAWRHDVLDSC